MLTIKELNELNEQEVTETDLNRAYCYNSNDEGYCKGEVNLYAYGDHLLYWECDRHFAQDKKIFKNLRIIKLSEKEIFYLKCHR